MHFGYNEETWKLACREAKKILAGYAKGGKPISYSDLASQIRSATFDPASNAFAELLGEVSTREFNKGRGLLTVLVVHKGGDLKPGKGFFDLARSLGISGDDDKIWIDQFKFVIEFWKKR